MADLERFHTAMPLAASKECRPFFLLMRRNVWRELGPRPKALEASLVSAVDAVRCEIRRWCCQTGLNCRPLHYQWSALPLSYGSMPGDPESALKAPTGGRFLPQGPLSRKHEGGVLRGQKRRKISLRRRYRS